MNIRGLKGNVEQLRGEMGIMTIVYQDYGLAGSVGTRTSLGNETRLKPISTKLIVCPAVGRRAYARIGTSIQGSNLGSSSNQSPDLRVLSHPCGIDVSPFLNNEGRCQCSTICRNAFNHCD